MAVVDYRIEDHIAIVTLNRPEARNAINPEVAVRLAQAWEQVREDDTVRVLQPWSADRLPANPAWGLAWRNCYRVPRNVAIEDLPDSKSAVTPYI